MAFTLTKKEYIDKTIFKYFYDDYFYLDKKVLLLLRMSPCQCNSICYHLKKWSKKLSSKFEIYKFIAFSEILTLSFNHLFSIVQIEIFDHAESSVDVQKKQARSLVACVIVRD
jgi:hypothetical protein